MASKAWARAGPPRSRGTRARPRWGQGRRRAEPGGSRHLGSRLVPRAHRARGRKPAPAGTPRGWGDGAGHPSFYGDDLGPSVSRAEGAAQAVPGGLKPPPATPAVVSGKRSTGPHRGFQPHNCLFRAGSSRQSQTDGRARVPGGIWSLAGAGRSGRAWEIFRVVGRGGPRGIAWAPVSARPPARLPRREHQARGRPGSQGGPLCEVPRVSGQRARVA